MPRAKTKKKKATKKKEEVKPEEVVSKPETEETKPDLPDTDVTEESVTLVDPPNLSGPRPLKNGELGAISECPLAFKGDHMFTNGDDEVRKYVIAEGEIKRGDQVILRKDGEHWYARKEKWQLP